MTSRDENATDLKRAQWWDRRLRILGAVVMSCFGSMAVALFIWVGLWRSSNAETIGHASASYELTAFFLYLGAMFCFLGAWFVVQVSRELRLG